MSFVQRYFPTRQDVHREHLTVQSEHLQVVRGFHLRCMAGANDPAIRKNYGDIADLLEQAILEYQVLLANLESTSTK